MSEQRAFRFGWSRWEPSRPSRGRVGVVKILLLAGGAIGCGEGQPEPSPEPPRPALRAEAVTVDGAPIRRAEVFVGSDFVVAGRLLVVRSGDGSNEEGRRSPGLATLTVKDLSRGVGLGGGVARDIRSDGTFSATLSGVQRPGTFALELRAASGDSEFEPARLGDLVVKPRSEGATDSERKRGT